MPDWPFDIEETEVNAAPEGMDEDDESGEGFEEDDDE